MSQESDPKTSVSRRGFIRAVGLAPAVFQAVGTRAEGGCEPAAPGFWHSPRHSGVLLADLSSAEPPEAISPKPSKGCWYTIPYRTRTGIQGVMVARGQLTHPPDLRLSLPVRGWHAIYVGLEVYLGFRMGTMASMPPVWFEPVQFWKRHPQWRCRDREGHGIVRLSLAYSQVRRFQGVTRGTRTVFFEDITPRNMPGSRYARQARRAYAGGAAGLAFWDSGGRIMRKTQGHTVRRLGHRRDLESMARQPREYCIHPLQLIDGWSVELRYR